MAELALKIGRGANYDDGDILCAFNLRRIRCTHAQHICHRRLADMRDLNSVARDWYEITHQYRFERVSRTEIKRVTLATMDEVIIDGTPRLIDGKMQHMAVEEYVRRRRSHPRHKLFGEKGKEFWYGGRHDFSQPKVDLVWDAIEAKTPNVRTGFNRWPVGRQDLKSHLFLPVTDFDDTEAVRLVAPELDETDPDNPIVLQKRLRQVHWRDYVPTRDHSRVEDKAIEVDLREAIADLDRTTAVREKASLRTVSR